MKFENSYAALPENFWASTKPTVFSRSRLIRLNRPLAGQLGFEQGEKSDADILKTFSGEYTPFDARPVAMVYAGHQFGNFVPTLGDGRAMLMGEIIDESGIRRDIHLKGSGPTPFSRRGDGFSPLGPVLREYLVSEAMHRLGIPTTRSLAAIGTNETVMRETDLPGGILVRVAKSHIRIGTFQYFAARRDIENLQRLADYTIDRLYPDLADTDNPYPGFLSRVVEQQARLIAHWMGAGFIHGVMNTDNMAVSGETIDYGPCAFMDSYDVGTVFSSIDIQGRYAYGNQPAVARWNLIRLAESLLPLLDDENGRAVEKAEIAIESFASCYQKFFSEVFSRKLGVSPKNDLSPDLITGLLEMMADEKTDFTMTFRALADANHNSCTLRALIGGHRNFNKWFEVWQKLYANHNVGGSNLKTVNPIYIPRNHLVEDAAISGSNGDISKFESLLDILNDPFTERPDSERYALPPDMNDRVMRTFCGT